LNLLDPATMALGDITPLAVVGFDTDETQAASVDSQSYVMDARASGWPIRLDYHLRGTLGERAIAHYFRRHKLAVAGPPPEYLGPTASRPASTPGGAKEPVDIVIWTREGEPLKLGVRTVDHGSASIAKFGTIPYPAKRDPTARRFPDYLLAATVQIDEDLWLWHCGPCVEGMLLATARVAIWGALAKGEYQALYRKLETVPGRPAFKPIPLAAFRPDTLRQVVEGAQRARG
jgi:hypothetical protein